MPFSTQGPALVLVPAVQAGISDERARFREIFCEVLEARKDQIEDYRPCSDAMTRLADEPPGTGRAVDLGLAKRRLVALTVPGVGYECFEPWLQPPGTSRRHVGKFGYELDLLKVDPLSGTAKNARLIRDALMSMAPGQGARPYIVLVGYSKGTPDILEALAAYPEIRGRVAAVVSVAGAIGGSALANDATQNQADLLRHFPQATCDSGDRGAVESLRPDTRKAWLAQNKLPEGPRYYSLVTLPQPERISLILRPSWSKLARIDARNDSQVIFYDQVIPGSALMGYLNADHWAIAVPLNRSRPVISETLVTQNAFPREALVEAILRFVEESLAP
ncbi:hypothetical protein [Variovorax sp. OV329]|uniref:hypothetical protein n=1 Tax=Variovorax sp. OV329 TaxID=1882825 RepID=UPI0020C893E4|nr:hypothetical protein [Variovorax sp. OV329]